MRITVRTEMKAPGGIGPSPTCVRDLMCMPWVRNNTKSTVQLTMHSIVWKMLVAMLVVRGWRIGFLLFVIIMGVCLTG